MKVILETHRAQLIRYLRFYYYHWVGTSTGGLIVPDCIIYLLAIKDVYRS